MRFCRCQSYATPCITFLRADSGRSGAPPGDAAGDAAPLAQGGLGTRAEAAGARGPLGAPGVRAGAAAAGPLAAVPAGEPEPAHPGGVDYSGYPQKEVIVAEVSGSGRGMGSC